MAQTDVIDIPVKKPGVLARVEWMKKGPVVCTDEEKKAIKDLFSQLKKQESAARREFVIRVWERRLFDRGFQHILISSNGGWKLPSVGTGYGYGEAGSKATFETNIFNSYNQILTSALTREVPTVRFKPKHANDGKGITAAENAENIKLKIVRDNPMLTLMEELCRYLYTDCAAVLHTYYAKDAQAFGYEPRAEEAVPETEEKISESEAAEEIEEDGEPETPTAIETLAEGDDNAEDDGEPDEEEDESEEEGERVAGREVIECHGMLEFRGAMKKGTLEKQGAVWISVEIDEYEGKAMYPKEAEHITKGSGGAGGDDIDRLARVNVDQGMMDSASTQDSEISDLTWERVWMRPWQLLKLHEDHRDAIIEKFPNGLYAHFCGDHLCATYDQSMDKALSLIHALPGDGMNRPSLGSWMMPIQKVLNKWLELSDDYFTRGVPAKWMDNEMFDVDAMADQVNQVGEVHPFDREPNVTMEQVIWEETPPTFPALLPQFIDSLKGDVAQLLTGAYPALFGGDTGSNDTMGGITIARDQSLGRLGLPWRRIKEGMARTMLQAVQCLADNHDGAVPVFGKLAIQVEMSDLQGDMDCYPEVDENFPESPTQKQNRVAELMMDVSTNPALAKYLDDPDNLEVLKDSIGLEKFVFPVLEARDKQLGEIQEMMDTGPVPNPAYQQLVQQDQELHVALQQAAGNPEAMQQIEAQATALEQQMQSTPQFLSSVQIDEECDDNETEALTTLRFLNGSQGRVLKNGTPDQQDSFKNIRCHYLEHKAAAKRQAALNQPPVVPKPVSVSMNAKDQPPEVAAQIAAKAGLKADAGSFAQKAALEAATKHPNEQVPVGT